MAEHEKRLIPKSAQFVVADLVAAQKQFREQFPKRPPPAPGQAPGPVAGDDWFLWVDGQLIKPEGALVIWNEAEGTLKFVGLK